MQVSNSQLNNTVRVYVSTFDGDVAVGEVTPPIRNEMIQRCTDTLVKQQRYCVWKLLDYALAHCCGGGVDSFDFYVDDNGKWYARSVNFSLSHCNNVVSVALSNNCVGLDVESVDNFARHVENAEFIERVLTDNEQLALRDVAVNKAETLAQMWTCKESIFKRQGGGTFVPKAFDTTKIATHTQLVAINGRKYALSVATDADSVTTKRVKIRW